ncbi:pao retrotransposon peptidase domain-containing protein [Phthorimaea operculella]|nr:pao retrotransposon peptidase domain-containing protein [Phthorimaea operculella]
MFRCINLDPKYRPLQNILWRDSPDQKIQCMQLNTVSFAQIIGYADAAQNTAYGACVYLRVVDESGNVRVSLQCSKSRVNPIKQDLTVPRMELNAAVLLANVLPETKDEPAPLNIMVCSQSSNDNERNVSLGLPEYSSINKMQRVLAYVLRFVRNLKPLMPFIDASGLVRVGGRLHFAAIPFSQKHPVILPTESYVTKLIIENEHVRNLHAGPRLVLASINQKFWIVQGPDNRVRVVEVKTANGRTHKRSVNKVCVLPIE